MVDEATLDATTPAAEMLPPRPGVFGSLRFRDFRFLWFAQNGRTAAMWMEQIARPVLILQLTDSALQVGLVVAVRMAPQLLFGLPAGLVADRFDRKRVLLVAQTVTMSSHLALAALVLTDIVAAWHVFALAFVTGTSLVFNQTARQSLIPQLVPKEYVQNAIALNMMALNTMRIVGPGIAGVLLLWGTGPVYLLAGMLAFAAILNVFVIEIKHQPRADHDTASWADDLRAGLRYVAAHPMIIAVLGPPLIMFVFGMPYINVFVPLFAKEVLDLGDSGVGVLVAVAGAGALIGSVFMASRTDLPSRGTLLLVFLGLFSGALLLFSRSTFLPLSIVLLMITASMSSAYMALTNSLLLELSPADMYGRVMSLMSLDRGLVPVGAIVAGVLAASLGPQDGLLVMAAVCLGLTLAAAIAAPVLRRV